MSILKSIKVVNVYDKDGQLIESAANVVLPDLNPPLFLLLGAAKESGLL